MGSPHNIAHRFFFLTSCFLCLPAALVICQTLHPLGGQPGAGSFLLHPADTLIQLPHRFTIETSETLLVGDRRLTRGEDYVIDNSAGTIRILSGTIAGDSARTLTVVYRYLPIQFRESYSRRQLVAVQDSARRDTLRFSKPSTLFDIDDIFGRDLHKSGSIVRGFTLGSNQDLSLSSGFRMQLAGKLAPDVEVAASLTDENTPIQPEGTTQTLQEFDKVYVELRGTSFDATLGDFDLGFRGTEFAQLSRKLQGAKGSARYDFGGTRGDIVLSGAEPRGKFNTNSYQGLEGVQGPYRLTGRNGERTIIVIAGTERVYVNGQQQIRGEINDYVIDYSTAEVTFASRRLITAASRIVIDFEYTDRQFTRSFLAARALTSAFSDKAILQLSYAREADNEDSPIEFEITDSARTILQNAGDNRDSAFVSGVTRVDSNGTYIRIDTTINGSPREIYRYDPGNLAALYIIRFSSVGFGRGEYVRLSAGEFEWRGPGNGEYLPVVFLPMPQSNQILNANLVLKPLPDLSITSEVGASLFDANRFSNRDDENNKGHALNLAARYTPASLRIGGTNLGTFDIGIRERFIDGKFVPIDRTNNIEFNRQWAIDRLTKDDEELQEFSLGYSPVSMLQVTGSYGRIQRGDSFKSNRKDGRITLQEEGLPAVAYFIEDINSTDNLAVNSSSWLRQLGNAAHAHDMITGTFRFEQEHREIVSLSSGGLQPGSLQFVVVAPGLLIRDLFGFRLSGEFEWRTDEALSQSTLAKESNTFTQTYSLKLPEVGGLYSLTDVALRSRRFTEEFKSMGSIDVKSVLTRHQTRYAPSSRGIEADFTYQASTQLSAKLDYVFIRVAPGTGNYIYLGDLNGNGIADESEFQQTRFEGNFTRITYPTEELFPVIDVGTSMRLRITPRRLFGQPQVGLERVLSIWTSETYARIDEKSREIELRKIYFLHPSSLQDDSTTISGSTLFTQDFLWLEGQPDFSGRLRYSQRKGLNKLSGGNERVYGRERSVRIRGQLISEFSAQIDFINRTDNLSSAGSTREHNIASNALTFDFSYRPQQQVELGFKIDVAASRDDQPASALDADFNGQSVRFVYSFVGLGQARVEVSREEVILSQAGSSFIYELTGGKVEGKAFLWRGAVDYRIVTFVQATVNYDGRVEGTRPAIHSARAEVRAFF